MDHPKTLRSELGVARERVVHCRLERDRLLKQIVALVLICIAITPAAADDTPTVASERKYFRDAGNFVGVEGSLAREGASPDDTHRWVVWCYQERRECLAFYIHLSSLVSIGPGIPIAYPIQVWTTDRIVAQRELACGDRETWRLDRLRKTAEVFWGSCLNQTTATHETIEDPSSWTKFQEKMKRLAKPGHHD
jgi:hypothetical protein